MKEIKHKGFDTNVHGERQPLEKPRLRIIQGLCGQNVKQPMVNKTVQVSRLLAQRPTTSPWPRVLAA